MIDQSNIEVERELFEKHFGPQNNFAWRNADGNYKVYALQSAWEVWQAARRADRPGTAARDLSDEQLLAIAQAQDYGDEAPKCILRLMRAVIAADRQCDAQAVGEVVANDPVHGWHVRALKPWNEIGEGALLYAGLPPRVTQSVVEAQNKILNQLEASSARLNALRAKYDIPLDAESTRLYHDKAFEMYAGSPVVGVEQIDDEVSQRTRTTYRLCTCVGVARGAHAGAAEDPVVEANRQLLLDRSRVGIAKYGVTLAGAGLSRVELLQHALEEALDLANYLQTIIQADRATTDTGEKA
jgi:hypothetical protein